MFFIVVMFLFGVGGVLFADFYHKEKERNKYSILKEKERREQWLEKELQFFKALYFSSIDDEDQEEVENVLKDRGHYNPKNIGMQFVSRQEQEEIENILKNLDCHKIVDIEDLEIEDLKI